MSNSRVIRLRLLAASSLLSAGLVGIIGLLPGQALAAGECGVPAGGAVSCAPGTYPTGIFYPTATPLTVTLQQTPTTAVNTTTGGITIIDAVAGDTLILNRSFTGVPAAGSTAPSIVNLTGNGIGVISNGTSTANLSAPTTDAGIVVSGSTNGIAVSSTGSGAVSLTLTNGTISGGGGAGVLASANGGLLTVNTGGAAITGTTGGIIATQFGGGAGLTVTAAGPVTATAGDGVTASITNVFNGSPLVVNVSGLITATGNGVTASNAGSGSTTVNQTAGDIEAQGANAISATATGSGSVTVTQAGTIGAAAAVGVGTPGNGISATTGSGAINVTANSINVAGEGVTATSGSGNITINTTAGGLVQAQGDAIAATSTGSGAINVNVHGNLTGDTNAGGFGAGLELSTNTGGITVVTDAGTTIQGLRSPVDIDAISTSGNISITSHSTLISPFGTAINANTGGAGSISIASSGSITALVDGIDATSNATGTGSVNVSNSGNIGATGAHIGGNGVLAQILNPASTASITVNDSASVFADGTYGLAAINLGSGAAIVNTGNGTALVPLTIDPATYGTYSSSATGPAVGSVGNFNTYAVGTAGTAGSAAVFAQSGAAANVGLTPSVTVATGSNDVFTVIGNDSHGIYAVNNNGVAGTGGVAVTTGAAEAITVSGSRDIGILAQSQGLGVVTVTTGTGTIVVNEAGLVGAGVSPRQAGIDAESVGGNVTVVNGSNITVTGSATDPSTGIFTANAGPGTITITNNGAVTSNTGNGISAQTATGALTITTTANVVSPTLATSSTAGISATAGVAPITVTVGNGAGVSGGFGVLISGASTVGVTNGGTITGSNSTVGDAIDIVAGGATTVTNLATGTLTSVGGTAPSAAVWINAAGPLTLTNAGAVTTSQAGHNGYAVTLVGTGAATIANTGAGVIDGRLSVGNGGVTFNNAATWNTNGTSTFGTGANVLNNSGTLAAGLSGTALVPAATVSTTTFTGLGALNNSGAITMVNGLAGDTLSTSGTYAGSGAGSLAIDVLAAPVPVVDHLTIGGAATGSTAVTLVPIGNPGLVNGAVVAHANTVGSSATAFSVAPGSVNEGFIHYGIVYNAGTGNYQLFGTPNGSVYELALLGEATHNLWYRTSDAWSDHMSELRDAQGAGDKTESGLHSWGVFTGGETDRNANRSFTAFGVTSNYAVGYHQNYVGGEAGLDGTSTMYGGAMVFGVSGGYIDSHAMFGGTGDELNAHAYNLGVYAGWMQGGLFINGLVKYDSVNADMRGTFAGYRTSENVNEWGGTLEAGYRFGMGTGWFLEPVGSISYVTGNLHDFSALGATFHFSDDDSSRGKLGLRTGTSMDIGWGSKLAPYAHIEAVDEFKGNDHVVFTSAGQSITFNNTAPKTYGEAGVGVDLIAQNGFTAFFEGHGDFGGDITGYGSRIGIRWKW